MLLHFLCLSLLVKAVVSYSAYIAPSSLAQYGASGSPPGPSYTPYNNYNGYLSASSGFLLSTVSAQGPGVSSGQYSPGATTANDVAAPVGGDTQPIWSNTTTALGYECTPMTFTTTETETATVTTTVYQTVPVYYSPTPVASPVPQAVSNDYNGGIGSSAFPAISTGSTEQGSYNGPGNPDLGSLAPFTNSSAPANQINTGSYVVPSGYNGVISGGNEGPFNGYTSTPGSGLPAYAPQSVSNQQYNGFISSTGSALSAYIPAAVTNQQYNGFVSSTGGSQAVYTPPSYLNQGSSGIVSAMGGNQPMYTPLSYPSQGSANVIGGPVSGQNQAPYMNTSTSGLYVVTGGYEPIPSASYNNLGGNQWLYSVPSSTTTRSYVLTGGYQAESPVSYSNPGGSQGLYNGYNSSSKGLYVVTGGYQAGPSVSYNNHGGTQEPYNGLSSATSNSLSTVTQGPTNYYAGVTGNGPPFLESLSTVQQGAPNGTSSTVSTMFPTYVNPSTSGSSAGMAAGSGAGTSIYNGIVPSGNAMTPVSPPPSSNTTATTTTHVVADYDSLRAMWSHSFSQSGPMKFPHLGLHYSSFNVLKSRSPIIPASPPNHLLASFDTPGARHIEISTMFASFTLYSLYMACTGPTGLNSPCNVAITGVKTSTMLRTGGMSSGLVTSEVTIPGFQRQPATPAHAEEVSPMTKISMNSTEWAGLSSINFVITVEGQGADLAIDDLEYDLVGPTFAKIKP